jgi:hypothetical protein
MMDHILRYINQTPERAPVTTPQLIGSGCFQLGFGGWGVLALVTPLFNLTVAFQDAVHGAPMAQASVLIQQGGIHLARCLVDKTLAVEQLADFVSFGRAQGPGWGWPGCWFLWGLSVAIQAAARDPHRLTSGGYAHGFG